MARIKTHPGEVLREEFMEPLGIGVRPLSKALGVPHTRIIGLIQERRAVTADTALRLSRYFDTTPQFWMNLQSAYDISKVAHEHGDDIDREVKTHAA